jgi:hypothetical protein
MNIYKSIFTERGSDILYHATYIRSAVSILKQNKFILSIGLTKTESEFMPKGKYYFLSASRVKFGAYSEEDLSPDQCTFVIDGRKLGNSYKILPIDYWKHSSAVSSRRDEAEDRVFSEDPYIGPVSKYVTEIHCNYEDEDEDMESYVDAIYKLSKKLGIPVYIYNNLYDYSLQKKDKAIDFTAGSDITDIDDDEDSDGNGSKSLTETIEAITMFLELGSWLDWEKLSFLYSSTIRKMAYVKDSDIYALMRDLHIAKSNPRITKKLTDAMRKYRLSSIKDLYLYIRDKYVRFEKEGAAEKKRRSSS